MDALYPLLDFLNQPHETLPAQFEDWQIEKIGGGINNLLYRVTGEAGDFAVKFTIRDVRRRAEREYRALKVLHRCEPHLAAKPILLEQDRYTQPVVVQTWLAGEVSPEVFQTDDEWQALIDHIAAVHRVTAEQIDAAAGELGFTLPKPIIYAESPEQCHALLQRQLERLPEEARPADLRDLLARFGAMPIPDYPVPPLSLVRADPNPRNFIRRAGLWASVDWEYSGVTDPAFEIADICSHAAYMSLSPERWQWVIQQYCKAVKDDACAMRIEVYWRTMVMWWVIRFAQYLYEIPRGLDPRLVERSPGWQEDARRKYAYYVALAERLFKG